MLDHETCYRAVSSRDARFDGWFVTAVTTTGIYCRPSCPATTPKRRNVTFHPTAAAAQQAGFRACRRCRPDASPGSPEWNVRSDTVGPRDAADRRRRRRPRRRHRAGRPARLQRAAAAPAARRRGRRRRAGAGPRPARPHRAGAVETTDLPFAEVAFAAGFASIRQFNDTVRAVFATTPRELRRRAAPQPRRRRAGHLSLRLPVRPPFDGAGLLRLLGTKAVPGRRGGRRRRRTAGRCCCRTARPPSRCTPAGDHVRCDAATAPTRATSSLRWPACRRLLDLDADSAAVDEALGADPLLAPLVAAWPGVRVPGRGRRRRDGGAGGHRPAGLGRRRPHVAARLVGGVRQAGHRAPTARVTHHFPTAEALAAVDPETLPMPRSRGRTLVALCTAARRRPHRPRPGRRPRRRPTAALLALPGIGPWTADYLRLRALGDPDVLLPDRPRRPPRPGSARRPGRPSLGGRRAAEAWRPWRSYALMHLWHLVTDRETAVTRPRHDPALTTCTTTDRQPGRPAAADQRRHRR